MDTDLIYGIDDRPPLKETLFAAIQHLLAIFVAIITPPLIIAGALKLDLETTGFLVSMALFASGVSTFVQCRKLGPVGAGLLCIQGTSFSFIGPIITAGLAGGLPLIFGVCIAASPVEMIVSRTFKVSALGDYSLGIGYRGVAHRLELDQGRSGRLRRGVYGYG